MNDNIDKVDFGFSKVTKEEKTEKVSKLFGEVSENYDLMNDLMSFGAHRLWKSYLIDKLCCGRVNHLLDLAGGTGDIAFRYLERRGAGKVTVCDLTPEMLYQGTKREEALISSDKLNWVAGNGEELPFKDNTFDAITISFGLRNVTNPDKLLREGHRVLKGGGRFFCLEFSQPDSEILQKAYDSYAFNIIPKIGHLVAKNANAYQYLVESINRFPTRSELCQWFDDAGFSDIFNQALAGGIVALHCGTKNS